MALTADYVRVGVTGAVYHGPTATTAPTDATTSLNAGFKEVGYIDEGGIKQSTSTDVTDIKAWQNGDVVRKVQTKHDLTFSFKMVEMNIETLDLYYGAGADASGADITGDEMAHESFVFEVVDGTNIIRIYVPDGQVTDRGDVVYAGSEPIGFEVTITAFPDDNGVKAYKYLSADVS